MRKVKTGKQMLEALRDGFGLTEDQFVEVHSKLVFDGYNNILRLNPRKSGFSRSNWHVVNTSPPNEEIKPPKGGGVYMSPETPSLTIRFGDKVSIYNNTVYIGQLERGSSVQAPQGMVWPTINKLNGEMTRRLDILSRKNLNI